MHSFFFFFFFLVNTKKILISSTPEKMFLVVFNIYKKKLLKFMIQETFNRIIDKINLF